MKKSFTLLELIIVIILITSTYYLVFSSSNFSIKNETKKVSLKKIKDYLITNFEYEEKIEFLCIENEFKCYVRIDEKIQNGLVIKNLFNTKPEAYEYKKEANQIDYGTVNIDDISEDIIFIYSIDDDYKSSDIILDTLEEKVYLFNSIFDEAEVFTSLDEVFQSFSNKQIEVQDAF